MNLRRNPDAPPPDEPDETPMSPEETQAEFVRATLATADATEHLCYLFEKYLLSLNVIGPDDTEYQDLD
jgi:hypothetical protein